MTGNDNPNKNNKNNKNSNSPSLELKGELDSEKLRRGIVAGSLIAGIYFFDYFAADEWYEKDQDGNFILKRKDRIKEFFD